MLGTTAISVGGGSRSARSARQTKRSRSRLQVRPSREGGDAFVRAGPVHEGSCVLDREGADLVREQPEFTLDRPLNAASIPHRLDFRLLRHPKNFSESDRVAAKNCQRKQPSPGSPLNWQSQQVRRISAWREPISAVSAWVRWGASPLQPSKTTRNFGHANDRRTSCVRRLAEERGLRSNSLWGVRH